MNFNNIYFKGTFRDYQQRVLDNSSKFLLDGKIHIVAAPGSGKTILGLELIRRLNSHALIFSPTTTIRQQWGQRFSDFFLKENQDVNDYISYDLNEIKLINSVTYQALHSAINKIEINDEDEHFDYSNIDLFKLVRDKEIKTICLDEAHHLQNEWQKALEKFIKGLDQNIKIISLTATLPYDTTPAEWERYTSVCGEIDDEIFVPELVKENTLCPHQDYILFNYPTKKEIETFKNHRLNSLLAIDEMRHVSFINQINRRIHKIHASDESFIYANFKDIVAVSIYLNDAQIKIDKSLFKKLTNSNKIPNLDLIYAERAYQFLIINDLILSTDEKNEMINILKKHSLYHRNKVRLDLNEKLKRSLISSCGKLTSISKIAKVEDETLKEDLRLLILTDYIKKEEIAKIGKNTNIDNISVISIFETLRKNNSNIKIGCLSGSLVILPNNVKDILINKYELKENSFVTNNLSNTNYSVYSFKGNNKNKVDIVSKLFEDGIINILIGTQALLGEGWDSPSINSLILASYVGSFVLSNQMRGRAIRTYKFNKNKTANIWHLVTLEPNYIFETNVINQLYQKTSEDINKIHSADYETLSRRFDCFVGPNYSTGEIESGIERITYIEAPFSEKKINEINEKTINLAINRKNLRSIWKNALLVDTKMIIETKVPKEVKIPAMTFTNFIILSLYTLLTSICIFGIIRLFDIGLEQPLPLLGFLVMAVLGLFLMTKIYQIIGFFIKHISPSHSFIAIGKAILKTFKELKMIQGGAKLFVREDELKISTEIAIKKATLHEQNLFNTAITELLSPMKNPKYIIIKKNIHGHYDYNYSFACPTSLAKNAEIVNVFKDKLKHAIGSMDVKFVYTEDGRKLLVKCRKRSFITRNSGMIKQCQKLTKFD